MDDTSKGIEADVKIDSAPRGNNTVESEGIHLHHDRLGFSDGIGQRDLAFPAQARRHKVLGDVPGHVCAGTVHFGGRRKASDGLTAAM